MNYFVEDKRHEFIDFVEQNRQKGSTTALIKAAEETNGYLVVNNENMKKCVLEKSNLTEDQVVTLKDIKNSVLRGRESRPVFIDVSAVCLML